MKLRILISSLSVILFTFWSCSGNTSSSNTKDFSTNEGKTTTQKESPSSNTGMVNVEKKWIYYSEAMPQGGEMESVSCYSDNYYVIDGCKIALYYSFNVWPQSPLDMHKYDVSFTFIPVNESESEIQPTFDTEEANKRLYIRWSNGDVDKLDVGILTKETILLINPTSYQFQKKLNDLKKFSVGIITSDGKSYRYNFDITDLGNVNI